MDKDARILVFGASGMVGSAIVSKLKEQGYWNIIGTYHKRKPCDRDIELIRVDCTIYSEVESVYKRYMPEYVFLASARVGGIVANNTYKADFIYQNLAIASNIIYFAYKYRVKKLLNLGSSCIYPKHAPQPMKEEYLLTGPLEPTNEPYAIAKISAIKLCRYFNEQYGTNFISLMPTNLYGLKDNFNLETSHVLPALIRKFHLGKLLNESKWDTIVEDLKRYPLGFGFEGSLDYHERKSTLEALKEVGIEANKVTLWGTGRVYREFLHVDDCASACVYLMNHCDAEDMQKISSDFFVNVGTGKDILITDLAKLIKKIVGFKGEIVFDATKPDGTPRKLLDVSKIKSLGWEAKISLEEGIRQVYESYIHIGSIYKYSSRKFLEKR